MKVVEINPVNQSKIMTDYYAKKESIQAFFDYSYENDFEKRLDELNNRSFQREEIMRHLLSFNEKYHCSEATIANIQKLQEKQAVTVVAGQQAGVLTGPLYTIHKIVSTLKLAKEQEAKLNVPVIPIFWVAGEDHDFDEVNHVFTIRSEKLQKRKVSQRNDRKLPISSVVINKDSLANVVIEVFRDFQETPWTKSVLAIINEAIDKSDTYVDFFCFLIHKLFEDTGIVLIDSHNQQLRQLEVTFLKRLVRNSSSLQNCFLEQAKRLYEEGYGEPIERNEHNANLFYLYQGTRLLLEETKDGIYVDKQNIYQFTKEELLYKIEQEPFNFSNNVVTRPLMQEYLFPVLAFVGGPGEVSYWATLKRAFHLFDFKIPPVVPRLSITVLEPQIDKWLNEFELSVEEVFNKGINSAEITLGLNAEKERIDEAVYEVLNQFTNIHEPLKRLALEYSKGLEGLVHKNEHIIKEEITFLGREIEKSVRQKYQHELSKLKLIETNLLPGGGPQERSLNVVKYLNTYGFDFIKQLIESPLQFNLNHKVIVLK